MDRKTNLILGSVFILTSGLCYTIERLSAYVLWSAQLNGGSYPTTPKMPALFDNLFVPFFLIFGFIFIVIGLKHKIILIGVKN